MAAAQSAWCIHTLEAIGIEPRPVVWRRYNAMTTPDSATAPLPTFGTSTNCAGAS